MTGHTGSFVGQVDVGRFFALEHIGGIRVVELAPGGRRMAFLASHRDMRGVIELGVDIPAIRCHRFRDNGFLRRGRLDLVAVGATGKQGALPRRGGLGDAKMDGPVVREKNVPLPIGSLADALADERHVLIDEGRDLG